MPILALAYGLSLAAAEGIPLTPAQRESLRSFHAVFERQAKAPAQPREFVLRVLTYNIWGVPLDEDEEEEGSTQGLGRHDRYRAIGRILAQRRRDGTAPHLVAIQEAFHPRTPELVEEAGYPYVYQGNGRAAGKLLGSGLYILSEFPLEGFDSVDYGEDCTGADCWANKGAQGAQVKVPGLDTPLLFLNTHMNASTDGPTPPPEETERVRMAQVGKLTALMRRMGAGSLPAIASGDFNFQPSGKDYALFESETRFANSVSRCRELSCAGGGDFERIWRDSVDHHFYSAGPLQAAPIRAEQIFKEPVDGTMLSDHLGLEVHYRLSW